MIAPRRIDSVVVIGAGVVGLAAAIALRRALPAATVTLVQLPLDNAGWIDRLGAASPIIHKFHRQIGLDPRLFIQRAGAQPVHLRRYLTRGGTHVREACTAAIPFVEGVPLHQIWLRRHANGGATLPDYAALVRGLREAGGDDGGFGARFDPAGYRGLLGDMAASLGIVRHDSAAIRIDAADGAIAQVVTAEGTGLAADLFVDAAGPRSRLLMALGVEWQDWSHWLPALQLAVTKGGEAAPGEERLAWADDAIAWQTRLWTAHISPAADARWAGRLASVCAGNAVAIGEAGANAPVSDGAGLGLALDDIMRLIGLLPRPGGGGLERAEYCRRTAIAHESLVDWSSLCVATAAAPRPPGLAEMLDSFAARGRIAVRELDPILPGEWLARLMAIGPAPRRIDPTALALPASVIAATMARAG